MKNYFLAIIILTLFVGCRRPNKLENILTKDGGYWAVSIMQENGKYSYANGQINFIRNGDYRYYFSDNADIKGKDGQMLSSRWRYNQKDSLLKIGLDWKFKILRYTPDSIFLQKNEPKIAKFLFVKKVDKGHN